MANSPTGNHNQLMNMELYQQSSMLSSAEIDEFENAKKQIKSAWKAGVTWSVLLGVFTLIGIVGGSVLTSGSNEVGDGAVMLILSVIMIGMLVIISLLTFGVYKKSKMCAIILAVLMGLGMLNNLSNGINGGRSIAAILFALLFIYYFVNGVKGISTYKNYVSKFPDLKE